VREASSLEALDALLAEAGDDKLVVLDFTATWQVKPDGTTSSQPSVGSSWRGVAWRGVLLIATNE
jgi:hypothetical protein